LQAPRIADPVEKRSQLLIRAHNETLSVIAKSIAATQPRLQPARLRLSSVISITHQQLLLFRSANTNKEPNSDAVPKFM
jgi:hypothetical protein